MLSVCFTDSNTGYVAGLDSIYKTTNAGLSWIKYPIESGFGLSTIHFYNANIGYAAGGDFSGSNRVLYKTSNAGVSWTAQTIPSGYYRPNSFFSTSANICYLAGGYVLITTNGGTTWNILTTASNSDWSGVYFTSSTNGIIVGGKTSEGSIDRTTDGGTSWSTVYTNTKFLKSVYFVDENTGYVVGEDGIILRTITGGATWDSLTSPVTQTLNWVHFTDANNGWIVGDNGTILHTTNGGVAFVEEESIDAIPSEFLLSQNYPNPFNPSTKLSYSIAQTGLVTLKVYDILGNEIETLVNEEKTVGTYELNWHASNLPSGVYFYQLRAGDFIQTKKMLLLK